jgi:hypothetical protein
MLKLRRGTSYAATIGVDGGQEHGGQGMCCSSICKGKLDGPRALTRAMDGSQVAAHIAIHWPVLPITVECHNSCNSAILVGIVGQQQPTATQKRLLRLGRESGPLDALVNEFYSSFVHIARRQRSWVHNQEH